MYINDKWMSQQSHLSWDATKGYPHFDSLIHVYVCLGDGLFSQKAVECARIAVCIDSVSSPDFRSDSCCSLWLKTVCHIWHVVTHSSVKVASSSTSCLLH